MGILYINIIFRRQLTDQRQYYRNVFNKMYIVLYELSKT